MSDARLAILQRVRDAQRTGYVPRPDGHVRLPADGAHAPGGAAVPGLQRFLAESSALGVTHHVEETDDGVRARVAAIVGQRTVLSWDFDCLPYEVGRVLPAGAATGRSSRDAQAAAEIGVTGCHAAVAETGSLVVLSGPGTPRAASLLPPVHLCVVRRGDLLPTMGDFFRQRVAEIAAAACCTFITGPSRTADIELTLTLGVHGPGEVFVVVGP